MRTLILLLTLSFFLPAEGFAACLIRGPNSSAENNRDLLSLLLAKAETCPRNVLALRQLILQDGLKLHPTMVANRGFHNPGAGSFSLFEMAEGTSALTGLPVATRDFFFGHFTEAGGGGVLNLAQEPRGGALMVELIAWDAAKKMYNFYELIGAGETGGQWFYRGDSADIAADTKLLHLQADPARPVFGQRLRCSGCHTNGGPIMKEITLPHNDWWEPARKLPLGGRMPESAMANILSDLVPASSLAAAVKEGSGRLAATAAVAAKLSLPEKLRPLFCPVELNLASDPSPSKTGSAIRIPGGFFLDERLAAGGVPIAFSDYERGKSVLGFHFPETNLDDADHAWLTPVKAHADALAVEQLILEGLIDDKFSLAILAVDFTNPVFSAGRCSLLRLVPAFPAPDWKKEFLSALRALPANAYAAEAARNLSDPQRTPAWFRAQGARFLSSCGERVSAAGPTPYLELLAQRRAEARVSEISKNPRGQILEPGFRVIFPEPARPARPGRLKLSAGCDVVGA